METHCVSDNRNVSNCYYSGKTSESFNSKILHRDR